MSATPDTTTTTLVVGANGATGRRLVGQLLERGVPVRAVVRERNRLPDALLAHPGLSVVEASLADASDAELGELVHGCRAIASCLGHNLTWQGMFGRPRRLVADAVRRLASAAIAAGPPVPVRFALMNTAGNRNRAIDEPVSWPQHAVIGLLRLLLPPHVDNEQAADWLRTAIGQRHAALEWVVVRPDTLTDAEEVSDYSVHASPIRSAIFDPGRTSRINVAHFIAELLTDEPTWQRWRGQMPVIYDDV